MKEIYRLNKIPFISFLLSIIVLFYYYHPILLDPNDFLFSTTGDGIKNYFTYLYHARFGDSLTEFTGMNYPYGEHITYTDGHPALSNLVRILGLSKYGVGILNYCILLAFPICTFFVAKILQNFKTSTILIIVFSLTITYLSPHSFRIDGHYSLSYSFAIPMIWWFQLKYTETRNWIYATLVPLSCLVLLFTHPYLGLICIIFTLTYYLIQWISDRKKYIYLLQLFIQGIIPVVLFKLIISWTDTHLNRTENPSGFFSNYGNLRSVFTPFESPFNSFFRNSLKIESVNWETGAYLGIGVILLILTSLILLAINFKKTASKTWFKSPLFKYSVVAILLLIFSFCIPFKYEWARPILDILSPLKQFRALGRFAWVFYFIVTILSVVVLEKFIKRTGYKWLYSIFFLATAFSIIEGDFLQTKKSTKMARQNNIFKRNNLSSDQKELTEFLSEEKFDAFLFLPATHLSSEHIYMMGDHKAEFDCQWISYHTQLPMLNSMTSRMSLDEAYKFNNLFGPRYIEKEFLNDLKKNDHIAIITNGTGMKLFEKEIINEAKIIKEIGPYKVYQFEPTLFENNTERIDISNKHFSIQTGDGWSISDSVDWYFYEDFSSHESSASFYSPGAFEDIKHEWNVILHKTNKEIPVGKYKVSFWYYLGVDRPSVQAVIQQKYTTYGKWRDHKIIAHSNHIIENWCFVELDLDFTKDSENFDLLLTSGGNNNPYVIDDILIRPVHIDFSKNVSINDEEFLNYNNTMIYNESLSK